MPDNSLLVLLDEVRGKTLRMLQDVSEAEARWAPPGLQNSILWHAGHSYILAEWLALRTLGEATQVPDGWFEMFSWQSRPANVSADGWPPLSAVIARLVAQRDRLRHAVGRATEERLASTLTDNPARSVRSAIVHGFHDEACHCGEIQLLRKLQRSG